MIKPDELYEITVTGTNINHYKQYYPEIKIRTKIKVTGEQLSKSSHLKVKYICDFCGQVYERKAYSELRSGELNACKNCRQKKTQLTCQQKYGVDHPMQNEEIHKRSVENHINNFGKEANSLDFINGIPVSKVQKLICSHLDNFILNYEEDGYFYDLFNEKINLVIEYNGRGHDLQVRFNKISLEEFNKREEKRKQNILEKHKLLIINDPYDRLIHPRRFDEALPIICQAVDALENYNIIQIK